jgi:hypothetical protein
VLFVSRGAVFTVRGTRQREGGGHDRGRWRAPPRWSAHPSTMRSLAQALEVRVPELYRNQISPPPSHDGPSSSSGTAHSYERLRDELRDAFPGIEYDADLERMAEQFVVELGWLQERTFPLELVQPPRTTLSAQDLLELADSFYRYRVERWTLGETGGAGHVRAYSS